MNTKTQLPQQLSEVAAQSQQLSDFGLLLREWNHRITRGDITNRPALAKAIENEPERLADKFTDGAIADAYLAAYAEWIADRIGIARPEWTHNPERSLEEPWFADNARASLLVLTPASFRQRNVFTIPEDTVRLRRGRPRVSTAQKKAKARARDQRYRDRMRQLIKLGREHSPN